MIARPPIVDAVRNRRRPHGETAGREIKAPLNAVRVRDDLGPQDYVIVTVKAPSLAAVAADIGPFLRPIPPWCSA